MKSNLEEKFKGLSLLLPTSGKTIGQIINKLKTFTTIQLKISPIILTMMNVNTMKSRLILTMHWGSRVYQRTWSSN